MKALIIGAGIAGPVLAIALRRVGIEAAAFEREPAGADQRGSWINFQANGMDALRAIGAASPVEELGFPVETMTFINGKGRVLGSVPMAAHRSDGLSSMMMPRAELYTALSRYASSQGVVVQYGKKLVDRALTDSGVIAQFADGTSAEGDILIGADGIHSRVRELIDPDAERPRYVPVLNVGGYIPDFTVAVPQGEFRMQFGTRCFFAWAPTPDGGTVWFANPPMKTEPERGVLSSMADAQWRSWLHELMGADVGPAHRIIDAAPGPMIGWATYDMPVVRRWHDGRGRMVLIGDAAHATSPAAGQGASMSLEDAVILAQCLRDCRSPASAFATYEALRRDRVQRIVKNGERSSNSKAVGPVGRVIRDLMLPIFFKRAERDGGKSMAWLQGHHIDFDRRIAPSESGQTDD